MKESMFQRKLIEELKEKFPGIIVLKNDATYLQGIPDLTLLYFEKWAFLEIKNSEDAHRQPNQEYYIDKANEMAFGDFVYPENKDKVISRLNNYFNGIIWGGEINGME